MAKIVRLTESDLTRLVKRVIKESDKPRKSRGILGHRDSWFDDMDSPTNPDEFEDYEEFEFGPDDFEEYLKHTSDIDNKWDFKMKSHKGDYGPGQRLYGAYTKDGPLTLRKKRSMEEGEEGEERSDEETKKLVDYFWDSMTTGQKRKLMTKVDKERKEQGLPPIRPKSSRIMKKDK